MMKKIVCEEMANKIVEYAVELQRAVQDIHVDKEGFVWSDKNRAKAKRRSMDITDMCVDLRKALYEFGV